MKAKFILLIAVAVAVSSCTVTKSLTKAEAYKGLYDEKPVAILALPPINRSTKVEAKELFYSSLVTPLTQKGYYLLPPLLTMEILKEESAYDAELFMDNSMTRVGEMFGVDAVLFTIIHEWTKTSIASQVKVDIEYIIKSTRTDEVLFTRRGAVIHDTSNSQGGLMGLAIGMLASALTKEIVVGRSCNVYTLSDIPAGKYSPDYQKDGLTAAGEKQFTKVLKSGY